MYFGALLAAGGVGVFSPVIFQGAYEIPFASVVMDLFVAPPIWVVVARQATVIDVMR